MSEPVRIGLVGYGLGGRVFHAPLIDSADNAVLAGVVTSDDGRRAQLAEAHPGVPAVGSLGELVEAGAEAVAISSTSGTHAELAHEALDSGCRWWSISRSPSRPSRRPRSTSMPSGPAPCCRCSRTAGGTGTSSPCTRAGRGHARRVIRFESRFARWRPARRAPGGAAAPRPSRRRPLRPRRAPRRPGGTAVRPGRGGLAERSSAATGPRDDDLAFVCGTPTSWCRRWRPTPGAATHAAFRVLGRGRVRLRGTDGQEDALRADLAPASEGGSVGRRARRGVGAPAPRRGPRAGADRARPLGRVLPGVRRSGPRRGRRTGGCTRRRPGPARPRRRPHQRHRPHRRRTALIHP